MNVAVTGATGALGLATTRMLVRAGYTVRAFVRSEERFRRLSPETRVEIAAGDILDRAAVAYGLEGTEAVIHCVDFAPRRYDLMWDALRHALEAAPRNAQLVFPGNVWVHGGPSSGERLGPEHAKEPGSRLGRLRLDLERAVLGEGGTVIRFPTFYGPGVARSWIRRVIEAAYRGRTVWFPGDLDRAREFMYIDDAARAAVAALGKPAARGSEFAAPGYRPISAHELVSMVAQSAGRTPRVRSIPPSILRLLAILHPDLRALRELLWAFEAPPVLDGTATRHSLGWVPEVDYPEGVRRTLKWLRAATRDRAGLRALDRSL